MAGTPNRCDHSACAGERCPIQSRRDMQCAISQESGAPKSGAPTNLGVDASAPGCVGNADEHTALHTDIAACAHTAEHAAASPERTKRTVVPLWCSQKSIFYYLTPTGLVVALVLLYRLTLSPYLGQSCRFTPTCSAYALEALRTRNFFVAIALTVWRILRCNPWGGCGYDPVPKPRSKRENKL